MQEKPINIAIKFAEIDNMPIARDQEGWVSIFVQKLKQTLAFYFQKPPAFSLKKATEGISENDFTTYDAVIYILSPAFIFSSNFHTDISAIEKACFFDTEYINARVYKVLKGPVKEEELPVTISMGRFYHFYQTASLTGSQYETLFENDSNQIAHARYWDSLTSLVIDLLNNLNHPKQERFRPAAKQTIFLGNGGMDQLWNRNRLLGELNARGLTILPDHDHSIEVKHLKEPAKFYLRKSRLAIYFPEEFIPLDENKLQELGDLTELKRLIWFDPEAERDLKKKTQYDELKLQLKHFEHIETISSGLEELKEIIFAALGKNDIADTEGGIPDQATLYLICSDYFTTDQQQQIIRLLENLNIRLLMPGKADGHEKRTRHYQHLKQADYSLICYDGQNTRWLRANINEVRKAAGLEAGKRKQIRLGIVSGFSALSNELAEYAPGIPLMDASSGSLAEALNDYVNGK